MDVKPDPPRAIDLLEEDDEFEEFETEGARRTSTSVSSHACEGGLGSAFLTRFLERPASAIPAWPRMRLFLFDAARSCDVGPPDWDPKEEDLQDVQQWEDDWDDQGADDDFSKQLRAELATKP